MELDLIPENQKKIEAMDHSSERIYLTIMEVVGRSKYIITNKIVDPPLIDNVIGLLCVNPANCLTAAKAMEHPFFKMSLEWSDVFDRKVKLPIVPVCHSRDCTDNFENEFTNAPVVPLKLQSDGLIQRLRCDYCFELVATGDEFQDF
ncbi:hypothetical protein PsorP6_000677 [Peronosclerospora sorghi]|uniref:Uncharacterized protein n=1 Tax=Peronosclerospora sorghi TaxID=230839 RepID=A0ACC0WTI7_9STRA|nr:hypothetical protein PsorP6_000677 [Peronosclerospora sorghi]